MKKILTILALAFSAGSFSQITVSSNLPSGMASASSVETEVKINKGAVGNFAKYQMDVPPGYMVSAIDVKGGNFTFENQRAKIVWVSVPSEAEFTIKLKVQANSDAANPGAFTQKFYYLENNEKKEVEGNTTIVTIGGGSAVALTPTETKPVETVTAVTPAETKTVAVETVASTPTETKPVETVKPVATVKPVETKTPTNTAKTTSEAGMTFKVQLGAYSTQPNKSKFNGVSNVSIDQVGGYYKVTAGSFKTKEDAIKYRDELTGKGFNGFIVKYQNGQRIN